MWTPEPTGMLMLCFQGLPYLLFSELLLMNPRRCDHQIVLSSNVKVLFISMKQKDSSKPYHLN